MREGSSLLDRLQKRFESVDSRADRRSIGMRERDSFLSHFSERMKKLEASFSSEINELRNENNQLRQDLAGRM